jgi:hypothetical protein
MFKFIKILFVLLLYLYIVIFQVNGQLEFLFYLASLLFFLSIILSLRYKNKHRINIFLIIALMNFFMIFTLYVHFISGILIFFCMAMILFFYCFSFISKKVNH